MAAFGTLAWAGLAQSSTTYYYKGYASQLSFPKLVPAENPKASLIKSAISFYGNKYGYDIPILTSLASCESSFRSICIIDSNKRLSCGIFQFQKTTLEGYCPDLKWNSSVNEDIQCAGRMIKDRVTMQKNWVTCSKKIL